MAAKSLKTTWNNEWILDEEFIKSAMQNPDSCIESHFFSHEDNKEESFFLSLYPNGKTEEHQHEFWIFVNFHMRHKHEVHLKLKVSTPPEFLKFRGFKKTIEFSFDGDESKGFCLGTHRQLMDLRMGFFKNSKFSLEIDMTMTSKKVQATYALQKNVLSQQLWMSNTKDFKIVVDNQEIMVHKRVMEVFSPFFQSEAEKVDILTFDFQTVQFACDFCYGSIEWENLNTDQLLSLLFFSDEYCMAALKKEIEYELHFHMNQNDGCKILNKLFKCKTKRTLKVYVDLMTYVLPNRKDWEYFKDLDSEVKVLFFDSMVIPECKGRALSDLNQIYLCVPLIIIMIIVFIFFKP